jgi:cyclopropane-fatty-acyl-phospholipid synthase
MKKIEENGMNSSAYYHQTQRLLEQADIQLNGSRPWDITVHNPEFYARIFQQGSLGLGQAYMEGWWDCQQLDHAFHKILQLDLPALIKKDPQLIINIVKSKLLNVQTKRRSRKVAHQHYNLGNDLYTAMLDKRLVYTCAYWKDAANLDQAQEHKLELVCKKLHLKPGMRILDIGCGWGSFARYAAERHGVQVVGVTISQEQVSLGSNLCANLPVEIRLQDYRDVNEQFDRIVSLGMFEHVGYKNYKTYMQVAHRCLKDNGIFLLHTIGGNSSATCGDPWLEKYIFPNSMLPSVKQIGHAIEGLFVMEDWHNFSTDYDKTLQAWYHNFETNWPALKPIYGETFYRMWRYYLLSCAGAFRARRCQLWQVVLTKNGLPGGYASVR